MLLKLSRNLNRRDENLDLRTLETKSRARASLKHKKWIDSRCNTPIQPFEDAQKNNIGKMKKAMGKCCKFYKILTHKYTNECHAKKFLVVELKAQTQTQVMTIN